MARNGSGTYSLYTPGNPVITGTTISSTAFNNTMNDLATALTGSVAADGQTLMTGTLRVSPSSGNGLTVTPVAGGAGVSVAGALSGSQSIIRVENSSNTASSSAILLATVGGTSAGDPFLRFNVSGATDWSLGIDNSDSDAFKFSASSALGTTDRLVLTTDGRLYGTALHNNAGAITGTTNQYIASGTYTPTLTDGGNLGATTAAICQYIRVGNVVTVSGGFTAAAVSPGVTTMNVSLPIASSNFATETQGAGTAALTESIFGKIRANVGAQTVGIVWSAAGSGSAAGSFSLTYLVL